MYQVKIYHFKPYIRRGDLEDTTELVASEIFKTRKAAKDFMKRKSKGEHKKYIEDFHRGSTPSCIKYYTGYSWINENSGESNDEFYLLKMIKV